MKYTISDEDKVVIGSGAVIEYYFHITKSMNMLHENIENRSISTNMIRYNIETYFKHLNKDILEKLNDENNKRIFNVLYNDIIENLDMLIENMEATYKLMDTNIEARIEEIDVLIASMKQTSYLRYEMVWSSIKKCYTEYEFIKINNYKKDQMEEQKEKYHEWLKTQDGKWFYINFNDISKAIIKFNYYQVCDQALYVYDDGDKSHARKETRFMNPLWIAQLYPEVTDLTIANQCVKEVREISSQYAEKMFRLYDSTVKYSFIDDFGERKDMWSVFVKYINKFLRLK